MKKHKLSCLKPALAVILAVCLAITLGTVIAGAAEQEQGAEADIKIKCSIALQSGLDFNIYVSLSAGADEILLDGDVYKTSELKITEIDGEDYYKLQKSLTATNALAPISLTASFKNEELSDISYTFSLYEYAKSIVEGEYTEEERALARDVLSYVRAAYAYFGNESEDIDRINALLSEGYDENHMPSSDKEEKTPASDMGFDSASISLLSSPTFIFYPKDGFSCADFSFRTENGEIDAENYGDFIAIRRSLFEITDDISFTSEAGTGSYNIYSYYNYVKREHSENEALIRLVERLIKCAESAIEYNSLSDAPSEDTCTHSYSSEVTKKPTATETGTLTYTCALCSDSYSEPIPTTLKVLSIGNSFSQDAMEHLYILCKDAGIENVVLGNLYKGGCSLSTHLSLMKNNSAGYIFYLSNAETNSMKTYKDPATALDAITYTDWDYITLQQASTSSGVSSTYTALNEIIDFVNKNKTSDATILWHMTWAYQANSDHSGFQNYNNNQMQMYNAIVSTVNELILTNSAISGVIPCGTAIQNLRTSPLGDTLTRDGYHLSKGVGRYTAALTYLAYITGIDIDSISAIPTNHPEIEGYLDYVKEAVGAAIEAPYSVTKSQYAPEDKEDELLPSTLSPLSESDKAYLSANGYSPDEYMLLDLTITPNAYYNSLTDSNLVIPSSSASKYNQYLATQIFTKAELPYGSLIRLDSGYKYRPDAWIDLEKNTTRPAQVSTNLVEINSSWWGNYTHRGFNISKSNEGTITAAEAESFKIYIKVVKRSTLTDADRDFLTSNGYNADEYMVLDFDYYLNAYYNSSTGSNLVTNANNCAKYLTTEYFSRYDLTLGSIIRLTASGYSYRPDAWVDLNDKNPNRPANTGASVTVVDASWWQSYTCRVFNLSRSDSAQIQDSDVSALRIYVKIP